MQTTAPQEEIFVAADKFFDSLEEKSIEPLSEIRLKRQSLSQSSTLRDKLQSASTTTTARMQARRKSQPFDVSHSVDIENINSMHRGNEDPSTNSSHVLPRSVIFGKMPASRPTVTHSPLPAPKRHANQPNDLSALRSALEALKNNSTATNFSSNVSRAKYAGRIAISTATIDKKSIVDVNLESLQQRVANITMAKTPGAAKTKTSSISATREQQARRQMTSSIARSEYDGDNDVIMESSTREGHENIEKGSEMTPNHHTFRQQGNTTTGRSSSRFRIEALRQGVTPLRVRERRASASPVVSAGAPTATFEQVGVERTIPKKEQKNQQEENTATPLSSSTASAISNNPLFAGTPSHPTPPSINAMRRPSLGMAQIVASSNAHGLLLKTPEASTVAGGTLLGAEGDGSDSILGSTASAKGIKLAEMLHATAEKITSGTKTTTASPFQFKDDIEALLLALDANTPLQNPAPSLADASTEERSQSRRRPGRLSSSLSPRHDAPILDLNGFDADGEKRERGQATPVLGTRVADDDVATPQGVGRRVISRIGATQLEEGKKEVVSTTPVTVLRQKINDLETERKEAASLLSTYQGTIAELQDRHSAVLVKLQSENALLKNETERLRGERTHINSQFEVLYKEKYVPLKKEAATLRHGVDALRNRLLEEGEKVKRIAELEAELSAAQAAISAARQSASAFKAEAEAAREAEESAEKRAADAVLATQKAEQKWAAKFGEEAKKAEKAFAGKEAEISSWKEKYNAILRQHDEAVHKAQLAQAAKERKAAEIGRKEDEICALQVRLKEYEHALQQYRAENSKFASTKEQYKAKLAELEHELAACLDDKNRLADMCSELLTRLESNEEQ